MTDRARPVRRRLIEMWSGYVGPLFIGLIIGGVGLHAWFHHGQFGSLGSMGGAIGLLAGGARVSLVVTLLCAALYALTAALLERRVLLAALGAALLTSPVWELATLLKTARAVERWRPIWLFEGMFFTILLLALGAGWWLHVALLSRGVPTMSRASDWLHARRWRRWTALGLIAATLAVSVKAITVMQFTFTYFAYFAVVIAWISAGTLVAHAIGLGLARLPRRARQIVAGVTLLGALAPTLALGVDGAVAAWHRSRFASLSLTLAPRPVVVALSWVGLSSVPNVDPAAIALDADVRCEARPETPASPALSTPSTRRRNVIIVSVDALRQDALFRIEGGRATTPNLDAFARSGARFDRAQTPYPATIFAVGSALTGLTPSQIVLSPRTPETIFTQTEGMFEHTSIVLPDVVWFKKPVIDELFIQGVETRRVKGARPQTRAFIEDLKSARAQKKRTLAWLHLYDPHHPYTPREGFMMGDAPHKGATRAQAYWSEVAYTDDALGELLRYLQADGWLEDSLILFFSDHGQALGELGYYGHHVFLNSWLLDIPLIMRAPGYEERASDARVSLVDITPTILSFLDVPKPPEMSGESLLGLLEQPARGEGRAVVAEAFALRGDRLFSFTREVLEEDGRSGRALEVLRDTRGRYTPKSAITLGTELLIVDHSLGLPELYRTDAEGDARLENIAAEHPARVDALRDRLSAWYHAQSQLIFCD